MGTASALGVASLTGFSDTESDTIHTLPSAVVWKNDDGTVTAAGRDGEVARDSRHDVAIQAAVDAVNAAGGGTIYVCDGVYWPFEPIELDTNVRLVGESMDDTVMKTGNLSNGDAVFTATDCSFITVSNFHIRDATRAKTGISLTNSSSRPSHHTVEYIHTSGLDVGVELLNVEDSRVRYSRIAGGNVGIRYTAPTGRAFVFDTHVLEYGGAGLEFDALQLGVNGGIFGTDDTAASHLKQIGPGAHLVSLHDCWFEQIPPVYDANGYGAGTLNVWGGYLICGNNNPVFAGDVAELSILGTHVYSKDGTAIEVAEHVPGYGFALGHHFGSNVYFSNRPYNGFSFGAGGPGYMKHERYMQMTPRNLADVGFSPEEAGIIAMHDGSGEHPRGLYRSDPEESAWVKVEDNAVTVPYASTDA